MNRILIAAAAVLTLSGAAFAQQSPELNGAYSANVLNGHNGSQDAGVDFQGSASIGGYDRAAPVQGPTDNSTVIWSDNYSR